MTPRRVHRRGRRSRAARPPHRRVIREVSAGGVITRRRSGAVQVCLVLRDRHGPPVWNLPKGHPEAGEGLRDAALREVREETGLIGRPRGAVGAIRYWYTAPKDAPRRAKTVHFFLMEAVGGRLSDHDAEVLQARWMTVPQALRRLTYPAERRVLQRAQRLLAEDA